MYSTGNSSVVLAIVEDARIIKGIGYGCDKEALRVVRSMPDWEPGRQHGRRVPVQFTLPVNYTLN